MKTALLVTNDSAYHDRLAAVVHDVLQPQNCLAAESLLEACQHLDADLLVVDLAVADASNSLCWGYVRRRHPKARLAVLFDEHCDYALHLACAAGAIGYAPRHARDEILGQCLEYVAGGTQVIPDVEFFERVCSKELPNTPDVQSIPAPDQALQRMTCREQEILRLLAGGSNNREIAALLDLNEKTVRNQMTVLFAKLGLASRTQAALWARDRGLGEKP